MPVPTSLANDLSHEEVLKEIQKTPTGAATIRVLHSSDIDASVLDEMAKGRASVYSSIYSWFA